MSQPYASPSHKGLITPAETPRREIGELLEASEDERTKDDPGRGGTALEAGPGASDPLNIDTTETSFNKDQSSLTALNIRGLVDLDSFFTLAISGAVVAIFVFGLMLQRRREYIVMRAQGPAFPRPASARRGEAAFVGASGLLAGLVVGLGLGLLLVDILTPLFILPPVASIPVGDIVLLTGLVMTATLVSTIAALSILRRLSPSEVLREQ